MARSPFVYVSVNIWRRSIRWYCPEVNRRQHARRGFAVALSLSPFCLFALLALRVNLASQRGVDELYLAEDDGPA
jgi:hypothetical protein